VSKKAEIQINKIKTTHIKLLRLICNSFHFHLNSFLGSIITRTKKQIR
jgi:hypothetical protein